MSENKELSEIVKIIKENQTFAIYIHIKTDIDAVGSSMGLKKVLESMGKTAHVFVDSFLPENASFVSGSEKINKEKLDKYDVAVVLDCNNENRMGKFKYKYKKGVKTSFSIDHHMENTGYCDVNYVVEGASSTCELILELIEELNIEINRDIAESLIAGILTDTGCLKFSSTHSSTLRKVADLMDKFDIDMDDVSFPIFNSLTYREFELKRLATNKIEFYLDNKLAIIALTADDFRTLDAVLEDTKGLVDIPMQLKDVCISVLIGEPKEEIGTYYLSIRSKKGYSSQRIALDFGGGGHFRAAGCMIKDSLDNVKEFVKDSCRKELRK